MSSASLQRVQPSRPSMSLIEPGLSRSKGESGLTTSSPDLIVHGVLGYERSMDQIRTEMRSILERLVSFANMKSHEAKVLTWQHVLVVGPGLGRDDHMQSCARIAFELAKEIEGLGVVVDADGLWLVQVGRGSLFLKCLESTVLMIIERTRRRPGVEGCAEDHLDAKHHGIQTSLPDHGTDTSHLPLGLS